MQDQEEAFWRIELVTHCICCSRGSCKSNRTALLQLSIETPFKQNKQNHSLHILWAAQRFCEITPVYKSHFRRFSHNCPSVNQIDVTHLPLLPSTTKLITSKVGLILSFSVTCGPERREKFLFLHDEQWEKNNEHFEPRSHPGLHDILHVWKALSHIHSQIHPEEADCRNKTKRTRLREWLCCWCGCFPKV